MTGQANFTFNTSDSITSFRVLVEVFLKDSEYFSENGLHFCSDFSTLISSKNPFFLEPKVPSFVVEGDTIVFPVSVVCEMDSPNKIDLSVSSSHIRFDKTHLPSFDLCGMNRRTRKLFTAKMENSPEKEVQISFSGNFEYEENQTK